MRKKLNVIMFSFILFNNIIMLAVIIACRDLPIFLIYRV